MKAWLILLGGSLVASGVHWPALAADFIVHSGETVPLGVPGVQTNYSFGTVQIDTGGVAELGGDVTLTVQGDVRIDGRLISFPDAVQIDGDPGEDGVDGPDNQPTGLNAGSGGTLGERGHDWVISGSLLTVRCQGSVFINGSVNLNPKLDGGKGGMGGAGGNGGSGAVGASGGFAGQAGSGNDGGLGGLPSTLRITAAKSIILGPTAVLSLDNLGAGGDGGDGADGGNGGSAGNANGSANGPPGGGGGPPGNGGNGTTGPSGGNLTLMADTISLLGTISLTGGHGGNGGNTGKPGSGGNGGSATANGFTGGRGGDAGAGGFTAGRGGLGGLGGSLYLRAQHLTNEAKLDFSGGRGGSGGVGVEAAFAKGGKGGTPNGQNGLDSPEFNDGKDGPDGVPGALYFWNNWNSAGNLFVGTWLMADLGGSAPPTLSTDAGILISTTNRAVALSSPVNIASTRPLEVALRYRWLTTAGAIDLLLAGVTVLHLDSASTPTGQWTETAFIVSDPAAIRPGTQSLALQLNPASSAQIEIGNLSIKTVSEKLSISRSPASTTQVDLIWFGITNTTYFLQAGTLSPGAWANVGSPLLGQGTWITVPQPVNTQVIGAYYRLGVSTNN